MKFPTFHSFFRPFLTFGKRTFPCAVSSLPLIALLLLAACGSPRRAETVAVPTDLPAEAEKGEQLFMNFCYKCHPGGTAGLGPSLNDKPLPGFAIKFQVREGWGVMPSFKKDVISAEELDDIVHYLKELRKIDQRTKN